MRTFWRRHNLSIIMALFLGYLSLPFVFSAYMYYLLVSGEFLPESDAIAIPIFGFIVLWLFAGIVIGFLWLAFIIFKDVYQGYEERSQIRL